MKLPCEIAVKSVVPAIRALLAKELTETYGLKQEKAADLLGITQAAISKYTHHVRGRVLEIETEKEVKLLTIKTAASLANGDLDRTALALQICTTCKLVRKKRLMCKLCKRVNPTLDIEHCKLCFLAPCEPVDAKEPRERTY
ncbi:MAG: transcriptional regulator [Candidatus Bathyarchaeia archaeon]